MQSALARLRTGLDSLGLPVDCAQTLFHYYEILKRWNRRYHLVSERDGADPVGFVERHLLDSVAPWRTALGFEAPQIGTNESDTPIPAQAPLPDSLSLRDIGSGGGLPGIPLAIILKRLNVNADVQLIDRSANKVGFLVSALAQLGLSNCTAHQQDLSADPAGPPVFGRQPEVVVTCRALSPWPFGLISSLERVHRGWFVYYAGTKDGIPPELSALVESRAGEILPYAVPYNPEVARHLVRLRLGPVR